MKSVKISILAGDGKTHVVETQASVWLKKVGLLKRNGTYIFSMDPVEVEMPAEIGYEFVEDLALLLDYDERKKLGEALQASF